MRKTAFVLFCAALLLCLTACAKQDASIGIIGGADGPTTIVVTGEDESFILQATITKIENGTMLVTPVEGSWELSSADCFCVPMEHMEPSPEPMVGDIVDILYNGEILESYPAELGKVLHIQVVGAAVGGDTCPAVCIDGVTYYDTGTAASTAPDESAVEYVEIPYGSKGTEGTIRAFARIEEGKRIVCLINDEWYAFEAK